jgi:HlyD family secretion protein
LRWLALSLTPLVLAIGCTQKTVQPKSLATGYVEATEIKVASKVAGRVLTVEATEGKRVAANETLVTLATTDTDLAIQRARAERDQADAQLRLLKAGSRPEDINQAQAQVAAAENDRRAAEAEVNAAKTDEARFDQLLRARAGTVKQRDDAKARRELAEARLKAAGDRANAASAGLDRLKAGARSQEVDGARARVAAIDAQIAALEQDKREAIIIAPVPGIVSSRLVEPGELVVPRTPLIVLVDLDHAWATAYVEEPQVPSLKIEQAATVITDAGDRLPGRITFISPRAEFTPRNVQTSQERAKLVYRIKVTVDNRQGILKPGMPVEVDFGIPSGASK